MGRIFETRKATMFARWNKMAKLFTRLSKDIAIAVKEGGADPTANASLRRALQNAHAGNMPKDTVEAAIKRALGKDTAHYDVVLYEGYAPHGIALIVEAATDNVTRTVANVRMHFKSNAGNLGASGSVTFLFRHVGVFRIAPTGVDADALEFALIDAGLDEFGESTDAHGAPQLVARCEFASFGSLQAAIEKSHVSVISAESEYIPKSLIQLDEAQAADALRLVEALERDEDVQRVFHNLG